MNFVIVKMIPSHLMLYNEARMDMLLPVTVYIHSIQQNCMGLFQIFFFWGGGVDLLFYEFFL